MVIKKIDFNSIKRDRFEENSDLIRLVDSYFQQQALNEEFFLPELKTFGNQTISIFSDYGGEHEGSKYNSYSFLFSGWNHSWGVGDAFSKIRKKYKLSKEISFKNLNDGPTQRALDEYLISLNENVQGFLFTVLIERDIKELFIGKQNDHLLSEIDANRLGKWKIKIAEKLMRVLHLISYVLPLISDSSQKIFWMSDQDPIVANSSIFNNTFKMLEMVLRIYTDNKYVFIGGAVPFKEKDAHTMDLLSITDLVAGSVEQYFTSEKKMGNPSVKNGAEKIIKWLSTQSLGLKKEVVRVYKEENGSLGIDGIIFNRE